jgi:hypothetical protein
MHADALNAACKHPPKLAYHSIEQAVFSKFLNIVKSRRQRSKKNQQWMMDDNVFGLCECDGDFSC